MSTETFIPDCYAIRSNGQPMPARFIGLDCAGMIELAAPSGKLYTFHPDYVLPVEEVEAQLQQDRIAYVAGHYTFEEISHSHGRREVRCVNPAHPVRSSYVLTITRSRRSCTCPAYVKSAGQGCKHISAWSLREDAKPGAETAPAVEPMPEAPAARKVETFTAEEW